MPCPTNRRPATPGWPGENGGASSAWRKTNDQAAVQALAEIDGITKAHLCRIDLISPDIEASEFCRSIDGGECSVHSIDPTGDLDAPDSRSIEPGVDCIPAIRQVHFGVRVEIHWCAGVQHTNVGQMARHITSGNVE